MKAAIALLMFMLASAGALASPGACSPAFIEVVIEAWHELLPQIRTEVTDDEGRVVDVVYDPDPDGYDDVDPPLGQEFERLGLRTRLITSFYCGSKTVKGEQVPGTFIQVQRHDSSYSHYWARITSPDCDGLKRLLTCQVLPKDGANWYVVPLQPSREE